MKNSHTHLCFAKLLCFAKMLRNPKNHFATLAPISQACVNSKRPCENQQSLKTLFKALQALFSFRTPHLLLAKASITLRRPSVHWFSLHWTPCGHPFEEATQTFKCDPDPSLTLHLSHGADERRLFRPFIVSRAQAKSLPSTRFYISGPQGPNHSRF